MFKTQNLYQNDDKWKNTKLGNSSETIGGWGCLLTSVTMMLNGIGYSETPETVNEKMKKAGGFQGAFFIPSVLPYVWPNCAYRDMQPCEAFPAPITQIDAALAAGKPVILQVDWNKQAGIQTHFVLVKEKKGSDYVLYDPYKYGGDGPDREVLLTARYKYNGAKIESEVSAVLW
ncbi:MAG: C39 family peptidase, partial [Anaerolineales bacterium]